LAPSPAPLYIYIERRKNNIEGRGNAIDAALVDVGGYTVEASI
jgi:hypothetical protein